MKIFFRPKPLYLMTGFTLVILGFTLAAIRYGLGANLIYVGVLFIGLASIWYTRPVYLGMTAILMAGNIWIHLSRTETIPFPTVHILLTFVIIAVMTELIHRIVIGLEHVTGDLQENNRRLQSILDAVQSGIFIVDAQTHTILEVNQVGAELLGLPESDILGKKREQFLESPALSPEGVRNVEGILVNPDGQRIPVIDSILPIVNNGSSLLVESILDIRDLREAEEKSRETEHRLGRVVEHMLDMVALLDAMGRIVYISPSCETILGFPQPTYFGKFALRGIHPDDKYQVVRTIRQSLAMDEEAIVEFRIRRADGEYIWLEVKGKPFYEPDNTLSGSVISARDITEKKKSEERLYESESKYRTLFNNIHDPILIIDRDTHLFLESNQAGIDLYGYSMDELRTMQPYAFYLPEDHDLVRESLAEESLKFTHAFTHVTRTGKKLDVEVHRELLEYSGKKVWLSFVHDLTERVHRERIMEVTQEIAQAALTVNNLTELYPRVHASLGKLIHAENLFIALYDDVCNELSFPYFVDQFDPPPPSCPVGYGLTEYVLRTGQPLLATPEVFGELVRQGEVKSIGADSVDWMGVPLIVGGHTIGVICVQSYTEEVRYSEQARDILVFVSAQVAMAVERKRAEEKLREAGEQYRTLVEQVNAIMYTDTADESNVFIYVSPQIETLTGYPSEDWLKDEGLWLRCLHPEDYDRVVTENLRTNISGEPFFIEYRLITRSGRIIWISDQALLVRDENGHPKCWQGVMQDITQRKEAEEKLRQSEAALAEVQELAHLGSFQFDGGFTNLLWSEESYRILGIPFGAPPTADMYYNLIHPDEREQVVQELQQTTQENKPFEMEYRLQLADGTVKFIHSMGRPTAKTTDEPGRYIGMIMDITDRKRTEEKLWLLSTHDALTGLFNRAYFESQVDHLWAEKCYPVSIVMVDVDGLKATNDTQGHAAGDELLRQAASVLQDSFRKQDIVARIGGDEFAIILPGMDSEAAQEGLQRLKRLLAKRNLIAHKYPLKISIGMATASPNEPFDLVFKRADEIMYQEKVNKRVGV